MTVMSARSAVLKERFRITAGRDFCARPRSTIQTSPRLGTSFLLVYQCKGLRRDGSQFVIGKRTIILRSDSACNSLIHAQLFSAREPFKSVQNCLRLTARRLKLGCRGRIASLSMRKESQLTLLVHGVEFACHQWPMWRNWQTR